MFWSKKQPDLVMKDCLIRYQKKEYKAAEKICRRLLCTDSRNAEYLIVLGNILFMERRPQEALEAYLQADSLCPGYYEAKINLANTYLETQDWKQAEVYARQSLELDSQSPQAYGILGQACLEQDKNSEALSALEQAQKLDSRNPWIYNYLSQAYQKKAEYSKALQAGWQAVELSGNDDDQAVGFGYLLYETALENGVDLPRKYAEMWLQKYPGSSITVHMANALKNPRQMTRADTWYVKNIFDAFAADFDEVLASLNYQTPKLIERILSEIWSADSKVVLRILDAGCGTGLCGNFLKKYAGFSALHGVDVSSKMLEKAAEKKCYDKLFCADLDSFFIGKKAVYDLIVSADVFTYFGSLETLLAAMSASLKKNGRLIFSYSENTLNGDGWFLHLSGRFLHRPGYVENSLENNGFVIEKTEYSALREEGGKPVFGYVVAARKI